MAERERNRLAEKQASARKRSAEAAADWKSISTRFLSAGFNDRCSSYEGLTVRQLRACLLLGLGLGMAEYKVSAKKSEALEDFRVRL